VTITPVKIVACIEDPLINEKILSHLQDKAASQTDLTSYLPTATASTTLAADAGTSIG
jgi:hypothetical protein